MHRFLLVTITVVSITATLSPLSVFGQMEVETTAARTQAFQQLVWDEPVRLEARLKVALDGGKHGRGGLADHGAIYARSTRSGACQPSARCSTTIRV